MPGVRRADEEGQKNQGRQPALEVYGVRHFLGLRFSVIAEESVPLPGKNPVTSSAGKGEAVRYTMHFDWLQGCSEVIETEANPPVVFGGFGIGAGVDESVAGEEAHACRVPGVDASADRVLTPGAGVILLEHSQRMLERGIPISRAEDAQGSRYVPDDVIAVRIVASPAHDSEPHETPYAISALAVRGNHDVGPLAVPLRAFPEIPYGVLDFQLPRPVIGAMPFDCTVEKAVQRDGTLEFLKSSSIVWGNVKPPVVAFCGHTSPERP